MDMTSETTLGQALLRLAWQLGRLTVRLVGIACGLIWLVVLVHMIGYEMGYCQRPEISDLGVFAACCFGMAGGIRIASGDW